jgi:hypothetical protein
MLKKKRRDILFVTVYLCFHSNRPHRRQREFAEVLTKGTLSPTTKPANWNVIITEKALLKAAKTPSPPPEEI